VPAVSVRETAGPRAPDARRPLAIAHARIYRSPQDPGLDHGTVLMRNGEVTEVGRELAIPPDAEVLDVQGRTVTAGFWNCHVHFTEPKWAGARDDPPAMLNARLAELATCRGFTTVVDAGSDPRSTFALRRRVATGELAGPAIYSAGQPIYPPHGIPYYVRGSIPFYLRWLIPKPSRPARARWAAERNFSWGADLLKLFTGAYVAPGTVRPMSEAVARAAVEVAHARRRLVYAHPSNRAGTVVALRAGVDVLAHAPDTPEGVDDELLGELAQRRTAMIPTLKMFETTVSSSSSYLGPIYEVVRRFRGLGGQLLFGTDVGYMTDYSTDAEFAALGRCGLGPREILAMLTTEPSRRFGVDGRQGTVEPGKAADLVILDGDPVADPSAFARVYGTIRGGRRLWPL